MVKKWICVMMMVLFFSVILIGCGSETKPEAAKSTVADQSEKGAWMPGKEKAPETEKAKDELSKMAGDME